MINNINLPPPFGDIKSICQSKDEQTLYLDDNDCGLSLKSSHSVVWKEYGMKEGENKQIKNTTPFFVFKKSLRHIELMLVGVSFDCISELLLLLTLPITSGLLFLFKMLKWCVIGIKGK